MLKSDYEDDGLTVLTDGNFLALVWRTSPTEQRVAAVEKVLERLVRDHASGFGVVVVIGGSVTLPSTALRERITSVLRRAVHSVKAVSWIVPSEGFQGSLVRSLLTAFFLVLRPSFKPQAFQSLTDGLSYVLGAIGRRDASYQSTLARQLETTARDPRAAMAQ